MACKKCGSWQKLSKEMVASDNYGNELWHEFYICNKCGEKEDMGPTSPPSKKKREMDKRKNEIFTGIYRYDFFGNKKEVRCPRCYSQKCSHYQEQKSIRGMATYSPNLNPLKPFTFVNKKENMKIENVSRFLCNECGKIFD